MKKLLNFLVVLLSFTTVVANATVQVKATASTKYGSWLSDSDKQKTIEKAQINAIENFFDEHGVAATENMEAIEQQFKEDPDHFMSGFEILDESSEAGVYTVRIRATLKDSKLLVAMKKASNAGNTNVQAKSPIVYVFYGRETDTRQSFHDRKVETSTIRGRVDVDSETTTNGHTTITSDTQGHSAYSRETAKVNASASRRDAYNARGNIRGSLSGSERANIRGRNYGASYRSAVAASCSMSASSSGSARTSVGYSAVASNSHYSSNAETNIDSNGYSTSNTTTNIRGNTRVEYGGHTTRRGDKVTYRMMPMDTYNTNITSVFTNAGYKVRDPAMVMDDDVMAALKKDFSSGNEVKPSTKRALVRKLSVSGVPYIVLATLDVGAPYRDPDTGMQRVDATVTAQVMDKNGDEVASTEAQHFFGLGNYNDETQTEALKKASMAAAQNVVYSMNNAGLR